MQVKITPPPPQPSPLKGEGVKSGPYLQMGIDYILTTKISTILILPLFVGFKLIKNNKIFGVTGTPWITGGRRRPARASGGGLHPRPGGPGLPQK